MILGRFTLTVLAMVLFSSCASTKPGVKMDSKASALNQFNETQKAKIVGGEIFDDSNLLFATTAYRPSLEDLAALKQVWFEYGNSFPDSQSIKDIEAALKDRDSQTVLVTLYTSEYENADLKNKTAGWAVGPTPTSIKELDTLDIPVRRLMPSPNTWARYYLVKFDRDTQTSSVIVSNGSAKVELQMK